MPRDEREAARLFKWAESLKKRAASRSSLGRQPKPSIGAKAEIALRPGMSLLSGEPEHVHRLALISLEAAAAVLTWAKPQIGAKSQ